MEAQNIHLKILKLNFTLYGMFLIDILSYFKAQFSLNVNLYQ